MKIPEIAISHLYLSTLPYKSKYINIKNLELEVYDVSSNLEHIKVKEFSLNTKNDYANISAHGEVQKETLHFDSLDIRQLNIDKLIALKTLLKKEDNTTSQPFTLIKAVDIDTLSLAIKPYKHKPYEISYFRLNAQNVNANIKPLLLHTKSMQITTDTNISSLKLDGAITKNHFSGDLSFHLKQKYFQQFTKIVDFKSLNPIKLSLEANPKNIEGMLSLKSKQVFANRYKNYPVAIKNLHTHLYYEMNSSHLKAVTDANVSTKYATSLHLKDTLTYDGNLSYGGTIDILGLQKFPDYSLPLFKDAKIHYQADSHNLTATLQTDKLHLLYKMFDYKKADFILSSKELNISNYFPQIPPFLSPLKAKLSATMALDFHKTESIMIENNITSNAITIKGKTVIKRGKVLTKTKTSLSQNSFLKKNYPAFKWQHIFPADLEISYHDRALGLLFQAPKKYFSNDFHYDFNNSKINNTLRIGVDQITLQGEKKNLHLSSHTYSLKTLQEACEKLYTFKHKPYDGEVDINATIQDLKTIDADIYSRWLVYEYTPNKFAFAEKIKTELQLTENQALIKNYRFSTYLDYDRIFYATKPSRIQFQNHTISLLSLWVNDALNTTGEYDFNKEQGAFHSKASSYHYKGVEGDITFETAIDTTLSQNRTHIEGYVDVKKGVITYEHRKTHDIQDPDIIIIQEQEQRRRAKEEKKSALSIDISINSKKPLRYKVPKIDISITPDIKIWKESHKELELLGRVLVNKGTYTESDKEFEILPGEVLFGGEILNPYLNLKAQYSNKPYIIDIDVTGTLDTPVINFSSSPYLSQSDILSMLLFSATTDSLFEGSANSSNQAISMLGNTFAKEIVKNFGLSLDKLVISTNEEGGLGIEIGKKISKKITVIYINDIVQSIKVRYQHSDNFETDLMLSPESSGIDFLYKSEH